MAIFEVLSDDTATTCRVIRLLEYAEAPSARCYVRIEQMTMAATLFQRQPSGAWIASAHTGGALILPGPDVELQLVELYQGLTIAAQEA